MALFTTGGQLGEDWHEQDLNSDFQIAKNRCYPLR